MALWGTGFLGAWEWVMRLKKILVIDDEPAIHRLLQIILEGEDFIVVGPEDRGDTEHSFTTSKPDLIILDIMMPEVDGFDVLEVLKADEDTREIPVIILTASSRSADVQKARRLGADVYLTKPFQPVDLLKAVRSVTSSQNTSRC